MKKSFLFVLFIPFLFIHGIVHAQDFWKLIPFPDSLMVSSLHVNSAGEILVGTVSSQNNGIFRSGDEGQSWEKILNTDSFQIYSFGISPEGNIWASTGGFYPFRVSFDNGSTWDTLPLPAGTGFTKIEFLGQDTVLLGSTYNNGALLLYTSDSGATLDTLFMTENHTSEFISDIAIAPNGDIYIGLMCYFPDMGGVYKSSDGGITWEYVGLLNHQVRDVEVNAQGDLFFGVYFDFLEGGGGVYALYHDSTQISERFWGPMVNGLAINSAGHIYASTGFPDGITVSKDNGFSFNYENGGLPAFPMGPLEKDSDDYIYSFFDGGSNYIYRTTYSTVGITESPMQTTMKRPQIVISPNPVSGIFQGRFNDNAPDGNYSYTITDVTGRKMADNWLLVSKNQLSVDISRLPTGYYTFNIRCNDMIYSARIIKR